MTAERPPHYFRPNSTARPDVVELRLEIPTDLELDYGAELAQAGIAERVKEREHGA